MKIAWWIGCALLALLWTLGAGVSVLLSQGAAVLIASGDATALGRGAAQWPVPEWLALWIDPRWVQAAQALLASLLGGLEAAGPTIASALQWLVPVIWIVWGLGLLLLLALAGGVHLLIGRWQRRQTHAA